MKNEKASTTPPLRFAVLATDVAIFTIRDNQLLVRMTKIDRPPHFPNAKGLPGGLIKPSETAEEAAVRIINDKAQLEARKIYLEQLYTFSAVDRDPRGRVVSVAYSAFIPWEQLTEEECLHTSNAWWSPIRECERLAYDHDLMLDIALTRLRSRIRYTTLVVRLMPKEFTLSELEVAYESILLTNLDKRNFRKKIMKLGVIKPLGRKKAHGAHRPAELYTFNTQKVTEIELL